MPGRQRIIDRCGVDAGDLLVKPALAGADLLDLREQVIEIVLVKNLPVDEPVFVQDIPLPGKGFQHAGSPLAELRGPRRVDAVPHRNDGGQGIEFVAVGFAVVGNLCKICTSCFLRQFAAGVDRLEVLGDNAAVHLKQPADGLLCQPDVAVLHPYLDAIGVGVFGKDQKVRGAVADTFFAVLRHHCHLPRRTYYQPAHRHKYKKRMLNMRFNILSGCGDRT